MTMLAGLARWWWYCCCAASSAAGLVVVLRFDGSYHRSEGGRNGDDPPSCRAAACAASLEVMASPKTGTVHLQGGGADLSSKMYLGGQLLDPRSIESSGQAEYEGVILGLQMLHQCMMEWLIPPQPSMDDDGTVRMVSNSRETVPWELRIAGDCKTVIRQLEGRARPRKLQASYDRARQLLDDVVLRHFPPLTNRRIFQTNASTSLKAVSSVSFEHIPRQVNALCDAVADASIEWEERRLELAVVEGLDEIANLCAAAKASVWDEAERRVFQHTKHFSLHQRLPLFGALAELSKTHHDFRSLHALGQRLEEELRRGMPRQHTAVGHDNDDARWTWLQKSSLTWQLQGLEGSTDRRHQREIEKLRQKLQRLSSQLPPGSNHTTFRSTIPPRCPLTVANLGDKNDDGASSPPRTLPHPHRHYVEEWTSRAFVSQEWRTGGRYVVCLGAQSPGSELVMS